MNMESFLFQFKWFWFCLPKGSGYNCQYNPEYKCLLPNLKEKPFRLSPTVWMSQEFSHWVLERVCLLTLTLRNKAQINLLSGLYSLWQSLLLNVYKQSPSFQPINNELLLYLLESHKLGPKSVFHTGLPSVNLHLLTVATHTWLRKKLSEILYFRQTQFANHTQIKIRTSC